MSNEALRLLEIRNWLNVNVLPRARPAAASRYPQGARAM
jgi:hypothetical protein